MFGLSKSVSKLRSLSKSKSSENSGESPKDVKKIKRKSKKKGSKSEDQTNPKRLEKGVVMVGNIPHGFYENQMFQYFSQFGKVLRLRISKNPKTGKRRNYGFVEFECEEVAKIVAQTMNNYLMFDQIVKCEFIPKEKLKEKPKLLSNWNKEFVSTTDRHKSSHNKTKTIEREFLLMRKRLKNVRQMESYLKEQGLDFKCQVINLPNISELRQQFADKQNQTKKEPKITKTKKPVVPKSDRPLMANCKVLESVPLLVKKSSKSLIRSPKYPRLLKFSILLSANKRKVH